MLLIIFMAICFYQKQENRLDLKYSPDKMISYKLNIDLPGKDHYLKDVW